MSNAEDVPTMKFRRGDNAIDVAGVEMYEDAVRKVAGRRPSDDDSREKNITVQLVREPDNPHDPNAVAVIAGAKGKIGYVPRELAAGMAKQLDQAIKKYSGLVISAPAEVVADWYDEDDPQAVDVSVSLMLSDGMDVNLQPAGKRGASSSRGKTKTQKLDDRPWWKKKRVLIPAGLVVLAAIFGGEADAAMMLMG